MTTFIGRLTIAALLCSVSTHAQSAPDINGRFAFLSQNFCEAKLTVTKDPQGRVTNVNLSQPGMVSSAIGYITFNSANMTATITGSTLIEGGSLRVGNSGFNWTQGPDNLTAKPYSFTNTTFTFDGETYKMAFGENAGGANNYRVVFLTRRFTNGNANPNCVQNIWAVKQPNEGP